jgi:hypothetical protein
LGRDTGARIGKRNAPDRSTNRDGWSLPWGAGSEVSFALEPLGSEVLLTLHHRRLQNRPTMLKRRCRLAHLDVLVARATGKDLACFWDGWWRLKQDYDRRLPARRQLCRCRLRPSSWAESAASAC